MVLPGNVIGYLDFGIVGSISKELQESLQSYIRNLFQGNFDRAIAEVFRWVTPSATTNLDQARQDLVLIFENYRYGSTNQAGHRRPLQLTSSFIIEMMSVLLLYFTV